MPEINPKHIDALLDMINRAPYFDLLSMRVCELGVGYSRIEVELKKKHLNPFGVIHGGVYSSILDTAAYWSAYCELEENAGFTSIDVFTEYLSMINEGLITVEGRTIKAGRSLCFTEAAAKDKNGRLLARATSKLMILQGKQSVNNIIESMGYDGLPPKFLG